MNGTDKERRKAENGKWKKMGRKVKMEDVTGIGRLEKE